MSRRIKAEEIVKMTEGRSFWERFDIMEQELGTWFAIYFYVELVAGLPEDFFGSLDFEKCATALLVGWRYPQYSLLQKLAGSMVGTGRSDDWAGFFYRLSADKRNSGNEALAVMADLLSDNHEAAIARECLEQLLAAPAGE